MILSDTTIRRCKQILPWLALGTYWPIIFIATHIPIARMPDLQVFGRDVTLHFTGYLFLTFLFWLARHHRLRPHWGSRYVYIIIGIVATYAAMDEFLQTFVNRNADIIDWLADMAGCLTALAILTLLRRWWHWLVTYWLVLFAITHWPIKDSAFVTLPPFWQQFQILYSFTAYLVLTLLFWRSICPQPRFMISSKIVIVTLILLPFYALMDESLSHLLLRGFDSRDLLAGLCGIVVGFICAAAFAQHHLSQK